METNWQNYTKELLRRHRGNNQAVKTHLIEKAAKDKDLLMQLVKLGASAMVGNALSHARKPEAAPSSPMPFRVYPSTTPASVAAMPLEAGTVVSIERPLMPREAAQAARQRWMDEYTLFGGAITLAKAHFNDLKESSGKHRQSGDRSFATAAFEMSVAERLYKTNKSTEEVFTDETLLDLKNATQQKKVRIA